MCVCVCVCVCVFRCLQFVLLVLAVIRTMFSFFVKPFLLLCGFTLFDLTPLNAGGRG